MATMEEILAETTAFVQSKQASFKTKSAIAGEDPDSMPGAEHDKSAPEVSADSEVNDGSMGPKSTRSTEGAGDDSPMTGGHATEAEEGAESVTKKPAITDNANADPKEASAKLANDILASIHAWQGRPAEKVAERGAEKATEKPAEKPAANAVEKTPEKSAGGLDIELTQDVLAKMAAIALSYDEGVTFMHDMLQKHAGATAADETVEFLATQNLEAEKQAAEAQGYADAQQALLQAAYEEGRKAASAQAPVSHEEQLADLGQKLADGSMADVMGALPEAGLGGPAGGEEIPAEAVMGEMAGEPGLDGAEGDEGDYTIEDLAAALDVLVSEGQIEADDAQQVLESVLSESGVEGGGELPIDEGAPVEEAPAEGAPVEEVPVEG